MSLRVKILFVLPALLLLPLGSPSDDAVANENGRTQISKGRLLRYNLEKRRLVVREAGKLVVYHVTPNGPVLSRTTVTIDDRRATLADLPEGERVIIHWRANREDGSRRDALKVDVPDGAPASGDN